MEIICLISLVIIWGLPGMVWSSLGKKLHWRQFLTQKASNQPRKSSDNDQYNIEIRQIIFIFYLWQFKIFIAFPYKLDL